MEEKIYDRQVTNFPADLYFEFNILMTFMHM